MDTTMPPVSHPGRLLKRELEARSLSATRLALALGVPSGRITDMLNGRRSITAETVVRLGRYFGKTETSVPPRACRIGCRKKRSTCRRESRTRATLAAIREEIERKHARFSGPLTVYGEQSRLASATLERAGITFKQMPYEAKART